MAIMNLVGNYNGIIIVTILCKFANFQFYKQCLFAHINLTHYQPYPSLMKFVDSTAVNFVTFSDILVYLYILWTQS